MSTAERVTTARKRRAQPRPVRPVSPCRSHEKIDFGCSRRSARMLRATPSGTRSATGPTGSRGDSGPLARLEACPICGSMNSRRPSGPGCSFCFTGRKISGRSRHRSCPRGSIYRVGRTGGGRSPRRVLPSVDAGLIKPGENLDRDDCLLRPQLHAGSVAVAELHPPTLERLLNPSEGVFSRHRSTTLEKLDGVLVDASGAGQVALSHVQHASGCLRMCRN